MSLLIMEGFEGYGTEAEFQKRWVNTNSSILFATGRFGTGQSLHLSGSSNQIHFALPAIINGTIIVQFAWRYSDDDLIDTQIIKFYSRGTIECSLRVPNPTGRLTFNLSNSTVVERTVEAVITGNQWHYFEVKVTIGNTGSFIVRVDGKEVLNSSGVDISVTGNTLVDEISFHRSGINPRIDDVIVMDTAGLVLNDFIGDHSIETTLPDGDGNRNDFTQLSGLTNWEMVDDGDSPDGDTTYNFGGTVGDDELYTHAALASTADSIPAIMVRNHCQKIEAGNRTIGTIVRSNVTEVVGADKGCRVQYGMYDSIYETDPDGGGAWTQAAVEAAEYGLTIKA